MHTNPSHRFSNREEAGRKLAERLARYAQAGDVIVLSLPNGGVPVGAEVAARLSKPFDVLCVETITTPGSDPIPLGAITSGGVRILDCAMMDRRNLSRSDISTAVLEAAQKLARREKLCRGHCPPLETADHTVIVIDDGTTPCAVIRDAIRLLRRQHAEHVIVALPAACHHHACDLRLEADAVITLAEPAQPQAAGTWFKEFPHTTDSEVRRLLSSRHRNLRVGNESLAMA